VALAASSYFYFKGAPRLTEKDTIVLADFTNCTGDAVFDGTLRQGLSVQLEQSPFLSIISDEQIQRTLQMMGQKPDVKLGPQIARELCQRVGSKAMLASSIVQIGTQYNLILKVNSCASGELLASTEAQASDKSHVLDALGRATSQIRNKLGESLSTVEKLATPLAQATTPSLEALQAYTLGRSQAVRGAPANAVPFLKRAIELDPNFALAYAGLSIFNSHTELGAQYATKAYELCDRVSDRERLYITTVYYEEVTGELDKTIETLKIMEQTYPRDDWARLHVGAAYERAGELAQAAEEYRAAISLNSQRVRSPKALGAVLLRLGRFDEAKAIFEEVIARKEDDIDVHLGLYRIAYVWRDATGTQREVEWATGKPDEFRMVWEQGELALGEGKLERAGELLRRADDLAVRRNLNGEVASGSTLLAAYRALLGDCHGVREHLASAEAASPKFQVRFATPLALCGYTRQAQVLIEDARASFPKDTKFRLAKYSLRAQRLRSITAIQKQPSSRYGPRSHTRMDIPVPHISVVSPFCKQISRLRPPPSSRKSFGGQMYLQPHLYKRSRISNWAVPMPCRATRLGRRPHIRTSLLCGKTPTLTFPFLSLPRRSTRSFNSPKSS
jgi:eukaryotic-like serine/threonine-protein kinase